MNDTTIAAIPYKRRTHDCVLDNEVHAYECNYWRRGKSHRPCSCGESARLKREESFRADLSALLNRYSRENGSDTPDFVLAKFVALALHAFDQAVLARDKWESAP